MAFVITRPVVVASAFIALPCTKNDVMLLQVKELLEQCGFEMNCQDTYLFASILNADGETYQVLYSRGHLSMHLSKGILTADLLHGVKVENLNEVKFLLSRVHCFSEDFKSLCAEKLLIH
ncbi:hypothetical protein [Pontibacter mangrovi]|uniref:Uncharacterized protein n=1 Tax=Pontibacter mangrovi TaxID=2589816 RepID=A0A501W6L6_9BACT|nr:hypothetical protein [Pontibacter mangrovi]TPE43940.1 hypothetical protein FJM65_10980 [Pontibacter mangrovi]